MRLASLMLFVAACGSSSSPDAPTGGGADAKVADGPTGGGPDAGAADAAPSGGTTFTLSITNFDNWCSIKEDGATFSATKQFAKDAVVHLEAMPLQGFVWRYWTGTDGDTTTDHDTMMMTTVTMTGNKSVVACCPFSNMPTCQ